MTLAHAYTVLDYARRREPLVAVQSYHCPTCGRLHLGRTAQLELGCDEAAVIQARNDNGARETQGEQEKR